MSNDIHDSVRAYYGEVLASSADLKTNACCATAAPPAWISGLVDNVHPEVLKRFYGCGYPIPEAVEGATVLDLGCGTGRDVFMLSQLVGADGRVIGVDMTDAQLEVARGTTDWHMARFGYDAPNVVFHTGYIEDLGDAPFEDGEVDVVISNCVVNLSPFKDRVFAEVFRALKPGGSFYFSDIVADRRLPDEIIRDPVLYGECLGGALYEGDVFELARQTGFKDPRILSRDPVAIYNPEIEAKVGAARFFSITYRLFKLDDLDWRCEDYGQIAIYKGTIPHHPGVFTLDDHHVFEARRPERVCGNTAAMLQETRFAPHFDIVGDRSEHFGVFDCTATMAADARADGATDGGCGC